MVINKRRVVLLLISILVSEIVLRSYLHMYPGTNLDVAGYNIHHLFTGLLLVVIGGLPLVFFHGNNRILDLNTLIFGCGLSLTMDEWVYLIATDGSDSSYLLPVSFWGAVIMIGLLLIYTFVLWLISKLIHADLKG